MVAEYENQPWSGSRLQGGSAGSLWMNRVWLFLGPSCFFCCSVWCCQGELGDSGPFLLHKSIKYVLIVLCAACLDMFAREGLTGGA